MVVTPPSPIAGAVWAAGGLVLYNLLIPIVPVKTTATYDGAWPWRTQNGIKDERGHYHQATNILFFSPFRELPDFVWVREGPASGTAGEGDGPGQHRLLRPERRPRQSSSSIATRCPIRCWPGCRSPPASTSSSTPAITSATSRGATSSRSRVGEPPAGPAAPRLSTTLSASPGGRLQRGPLPRHLGAEAGRYRNFTRCTRSAGRSRSPFAPTTSGSSPTSAIAIRSRALQATGRAGYLNRAAHPGEKGDYRARWLGTVD